MSLVSFTTSSQVLRLSDLVINSCSISLKLICAEEPDLENILSLSINLKPLTSLSLVKKKSFSTNSL